LLEALKMIPDHVNVQRVTAGIDNESLLAPSWCKNKNDKIRNINSELKKIGLKY